MSERSLSVTAGLGRGILLAGLLASAALTGCQSVPTRDPEFAPVRPLAPTPQANRNGAIYTGGYGVAVAEVDFFSDIRPRRVGDSLTVVLKERTNASKKNAAKVEKETDMTIANPMLFGRAPSVTIGGKKYTLEQSLESEQKFDGEGAASQSNSLTGEITVTVAEVLPNGNLVVQGEKILTLNRGHEHVRLSGIVRPEDVAMDNTVPSTRVANATIVYSGEGEVADASAMGWLARFFVSAFMPF